MSVASLFVGISRTKNTKRIKNFGTNGHVAAAIETTKELYSVGGQTVSGELELEIAREKASKSKSNAWKRGAKITKEDLLEAKQTGELTLKADAPPNFAPKADGIIKFGKHAGKTYEWVKQNDKNYCAWAREKGIKGF